MKLTLIAFAGVATLAAGLGAATAQPGPAAVPMAMTAKTPASKFLGPDELRPEQTLPSGRSSTPRRPNSRLPL